MMKSKLLVETGNILNMEADAMVFPAYRKPDVGGGLDAQVYEMAGKDELLEARKKIGELQTGQVCYTGSFYIKWYKYLIHAVSPGWDKSTDSEKILYKCYIESLKLAESLKCRSINFALLGSGARGFSYEKALEVAHDSIDCYIRNNSDSIIELIKIITYSSKEEYKKYVDFINAFKQLQRCELPDKRYVKQYSVIIRKLDAYIDNINSQTKDKFYLQSCGFRNSFEKEFKSYLKECPEQDNKTARDLYNDSVYKSIIREARENSDLTLQKIAENTGTTLDSISRYINITNRKGIPYRKAISFFKSSSNVLKLGLGLRLSKENLCKFMWSRGHAFPVSGLHYEILMDIDEGDYQYAIEKILSEEKI